MTTNIAFIGFGEAGQTISRGLLGAKERLDGRKTENRAELIRAIRDAMAAKDAAR